MSNPKLSLGGMIEFTIQNFEELERDVKIALAFGDEARVDLHLVLTGDGGVIRWPVQGAAPCNHGDDLGTLKARIQELETQLGNQIYRVKDLENFLGPAQVARFKRIRGL